VGAYIPGLSDWAGMVSVGGYAFGNSRYNLVGGQDVVPWFGGVYTRLDMTFIKNWDFSLQANNDSYFDWTGFARLTYRMGGSRRRTVSDQVEQPMMRNEHIVRAHQAPEQALIPYPAASIAAGVAGTPFVVYSVDNSSTDKPGGTGTYENPFHTLQQAQVAATTAYDIVFVRVGQSAACPYETPVGGYTFRASNQYLVGEGTSLKLCTANCGDISLWSTSTSSVYPVIQNPTGPAVVLNQDGVLVDHIKITGSPVGITDGLGMPAGGVASVNDVQIVGNGAGQTGVVIQDVARSGGTFNFTNMALSNLTADGFVVDGQAAGIQPLVNISNSTINNTSGSAILVNGVVGNGRVRVANSSIDGTTGPGISITGGNAIVESSTIKNVGIYGVQVSGGPVVAGVPQTTGTSTVQVVSSTITAQIGVQGSASNGGELLNLTINQNVLNAPTGGNGINLAINGTGTSGVINANLVGNKINVLPTTAIATGTVSPATVNSDIYLTTSNTASGLTSLNIKAASQDNLTALNNNATVTTNPIFNPVNTGTTSPLTPPPPPPNYNPAVVVPLPPP
jgi:hypothetical protein